MRRYAVIARMKCIDNGLDLLTEHIYFLTAIEDFESEAWLQRIKDRVEAAYESILPEVL